MDQDNPIEDDPDWENVHMHTHADGTHHLIVDYPVPERPPWWRQRQVWRYFRIEIGATAVYVAFLTVCVAVWDFSYITSGATAAVVGLLMGAQIKRVLSAYRIGFAMGVAAVPLAMQQKTPRLAAELIDRSSQLWDPPPHAVAHTMEIERLERDVNRGTL